MAKKTLIALFISLTLICMSSFVFATIDIQNGMQNLGNDVRTGIQATENVIENTAQDMTNNDEGLFNDDNDNMMTTDVTDDNDGYTTTRTGTDATGTNGIMNTTTMWTWVILAATAIIIVSLVWYYATQNNRD